MEAFGVQSENLSCLWNDVALLTDQRAYTFVCKTMLQIPEQEVETLQEIILADWQSGSAACDSLQFHGSIVLQIGYLSANGKRRAFKAEIPLQGQLPKPLVEHTAARLLYSHGQIADTCLLLEIVLQISRQQELQRGQVMIGSFKMREQLEFPFPWPDCEEVLATTAAAKVEEFHIAENQLQACGQYDLTLVYANREQPGEKVFAYQQQRPWQAVWDVPAGLQELDCIEPFYQEITVQILDGRHILFCGDGVLCTAGVEHDTVQTKQEGASKEKSLAAEQLNNQMAMVLQQLIQELQRCNREKEQQKETEENVPDEDSVSSCDEVCPVRNKEEAGKAVHPSVVNSRGSRRANLFKYMRDLNSSMQTPNSMRNFEFDIENKEE